ncbi:MAG: hypothetical protein IJ151_05740 [Bacteroidales bacterium]|nr:hypothetical protein [Bacteroidales bacterium]
MIHGVRNVTPEVASKLEAGLGISAENWLNMQNSFNLNKYKQAPFSETEGYNARYLEEDDYQVASCLSSPDTPYGGKRYSVFIPAKDDAIFCTIAERMGWELSV